MYLINIFLFLYYSFLVPIFKFQILYLAIINIAFALWLAFGITELPTTLLGTVHIPISLFWVLICQFTFYLACTKGPGRITEENFEKYCNYPHDEVMYASGIVCKTCNFEKPARWIIQHPWSGVCIIDLFGLIDTLKSVNYIGQNIAHSAGIV